MAPKRKVNSDSEEETAKEKPVKAPKAAKAAKVAVPVVPLNPDDFVNTEFPTSLSFAVKDAGTTRISCWNVAGIRAAAKKGLDTYIEAEDADILAFIETKIEADPSIASLNAKYPYRYFGADPKKGQAGVGACCKIEPKSIVYGLPGDATYQAATKGRLITLEFENTYVLVVYTPNAGAGLKEMDRKKEWNIQFERYLGELDAVKPVIWVGDQNVIPTENDIRNWKTNYNKTPGVTQIEIDGYNSQLNPKTGEGLVDVWRSLNPDKIAFTYYGYRAACRSKGIGWRLDQTIISKRILKNVKACEIRGECYGASDHLPVVLDITSL